MSNYIIQIGATGVFQELDNAIRRMEALNNTYERSRAAGKTIFNEANKAATQFNTGLDKLDAELRQTEAGMRKVSNTGKEMAVNANLAGGPATGAFAGLNKEVTKVSHSLGEYVKQSDGVQKVNSFASAGSILFTRLNLSIGAAATAAGVLLSRASAAAKEAEVLRTALTKAFNDDGLKAQATLNRLEEFAANTPFAFNEITQSFTKLVNRGFEPTIEQLTNIGDLASSQGKQFDQLVEAILDAQVGEFERLKEFGIKAKVAGDQVQLSFKGQTVEVAKTEQALRNAVIAFGQIDGVAGSLAAQSETLAGVESNLADAYDRLFRVIGSGVNEALKPLKSGFADVLNTVADWLDMTDAASVATEKLQGEFNAEVEVLKRGNFTQAERATIIQELNQKYGEYGFNLNAEKASLQEIEAAQRAVNDQFKERIILFAYQEELAELTKKAATLAKTAIESQKQLNRLPEAISTGVDAAGAPIVQLSKDFERISRAEEALGITRRDALKQIDDITTAQGDLRTEYETLAKSMNTSLDLLAVKYGNTSKAAAATGTATAAEIEKAALKLKDLLKGLNDEVLQSQLEQADPEKRLELEQEYQLKKIDEMTAGVEAAAKLAGVEVDITEEIAALKLAVDKEYQRKRLELEQEGVKARRAQEQADKDALKKIFEDYENLKIPDLLGRQTEEQTAQRQEQADAGIELLKGLQAQAEKTEAEINNSLTGIGDKLATAFGLDGNDFSILQDRLGDISAAFDSLAQSRIDEAEAAVSSAESRVSAAEDALDREIELAELGFASNVTLRREELAQEQSALAKAQEQKKKAVKAQIALDTVEQASGLVTATVKIINSFASLPVIGQILSAIAIGAMFAAFFDAKRRALQAANFGDGGEGKIGKDGVVIGHSHSDGGVPLNIEGGEFFTHDGQRFAVVNKRMTKKHYKAIQAINSDDAPGMAAALSGILTDKGYELNTEVGGQIVRLQEKVLILQRGADRGTEKRLDKLTGQVDQIIGKMPMQESVIDMGQYLIIKRGNKTIRIRK